MPSWARVKVFESGKIGCGRIKSWHLIGTGLYVGPAVPPARALGNAATAVNGKLRAKINQIKKKNSCPTRCNSREFWSFDPDFPVNLGPFAIGGGLFVANVLQSTIMELHCPVLVSQQRQQLLA